MSRRLITKRRLRVALVLLFVALAAIQFVPVVRSNPSVTAELQAPPEVAAVLRRACYDCHSNETVWPWYSYVAPVSWLVAHDVEEGRHSLNFSTWGEGSAKRQAHEREEVWEMVESGEMPLWFYVPLHPEAKLADADRAVLRAWSTAKGDDRAGD